MPNKNATKNISNKFANLYKKAHQKRLLTNNISKKFVKILNDIYNNRNKVKAALALQSLKGRR